MNRLNRWINGWMSEFMSLPGSWTERRPETELPSLSTSAPLVNAVPSIEKKSHNNNNKKSAPRSDRRSGSKLLIEK